MDFVVLTIPFDPDPFTFDEAAARRDGVPPYVVLHNREIAEIARRMPVTIDALCETASFGENKARWWGAELLSVVTGLHGRPPSPAASSPKPADVAESQPPAPSTPGTGGDTGFDGTEDSR